MNFKLSKNIFKALIPAAALILLLIPIATSSLLDLERQREEDLRLEQERLQKLAQEKKERKIYVMGKFEPTEREDFILIAAKYVVPGATRSKMYLRQEAYDAYVRMRDAAALDNVDLKIISAARNFDYQKELWDRKWTGKSLSDGENLLETTTEGPERFRKILEYSAVPGASRHHWGTDIDINAATPKYFKTKNGKEVYDWLAKNASLFGFCQPYTAGRMTGYNEEKWHWSYLPLARTFLAQYKELVVSGDISGFLGDAYVKDFNIVGDYVLGINPDCV